MTLHIPSRRALIGGAALAALTIAGVVVALNFWTIVGWVILLGALRLRYGRRGHSWIRRTVEAGALLVGARYAAHRVDALHEAKVDTERARAEELRSRVEHRRRTREEQEKAERVAYIRGAADAEGFAR